MKGKALCTAVALILAGCSRAPSAPSPGRVLSEFVAAWADTSKQGFRQHVFGDTPNLVSAIKSLRSEGVTRFSVHSLKERTAARGSLSGIMRLHFGDGAVLESHMRATVRASRVRASPSLISTQLLSWEALVVEEFGSPARGSLQSRSGAPLLAEGPERRAARPDLQTAVAMMERALEQRLAGGRGRRLLAGAALREIARVEPANAPAIRTSLDEELQKKAVETLAGRPGALVVLDPRDGGIRVLVSNPHPAQPGVSPAADGHLPGSTFKIVTAVAAAQAGALRPNQKIACPARARIAGRIITNFEDEASGTITVRSAFARSCNTAFARIGSALGLTRIGKAARDLGIDGTPTAGASPSYISLPRYEGEVATLAIGASTVTATPVAMAGVAATVARGGLRVLPHWGDGGEPKRRVLDAVSARNLLGMMEEVVKSGTGTKAAIPGVRLAGKSGTAEIRGVDGRVLGNDAWFLAVAPSRPARLVVVCYLPFGGVGGRNAAPLVREFLISVRPHLNAQS